MKILKIFGLFFIIILSGCESVKMSIVFVKETSKLIDYESLSNFLKVNRNFSEDQSFEESLNAKCARFLNEKYKVYRYVCVRGKRIYIIGAYNKTSGVYPDFVDRLRENEKQLLNFQTQLSEDVDDYLRKNKISSESSVKVLRTKEDWNSI